MGLETAAIIALSSAAVAGTGTAMSFAQAGKQRKAAEKARQSAERAINEAKAQMGVNYLDALSLPTTAYEAQREAVGQQAADILAESTQGEQRGVGAAAGRVMAARTEAERQLNSQIAQDMFRLEQMKKAEDARLAGALAGLSLSEAEGAQLAVREQEAARARSISQGAAGLGDLAKIGMQAAPLYSKTETPKNMSPVNLEQPASLGSPVVAAPTPAQGAQFPSMDRQNAIFNYYNSIFNPGSAGQYSPIFSSVTMPKG